MVIIVTSGFNLGLEYGKSKRIRVDFKEEFKIEDIENMAKETFENSKIKVKYTNEFKSGVIILGDNITDEKAEEFEAKLKGKYASFNDIEGNEENTEETKTENKIVQVISIPNANLYDVVKVYIKPVVIITISCIIIMAVAFRKLGIVKALGIPVASILGINLMYVSTVAILRIPVSEYIISLGVFVYIISLMLSVLFSKFAIEKA